MKIGGGGGVKLYTPSGVYRYAHRTAKCGNDFQPTASVVQLACIKQTKYFFLWDIHFSFSSSLK